MNSRHWRIAGCAALLAGALACGGESGETTSPAAPGVAPAKAPAAAAPAAKAPATAAPAPLKPAPTVKDLKLPEDFPSDVPLHPSAGITNVRPSNEKGLAASFLIEMREPGEVASFYVDGLEAKGWLTNVRDDGEGRVVLARKGDRTAALAILPVEGGTTVDLIVVRGN